MSRRTEDVDEIPWHFPVLNPNRIVTKSIQIELHMPDVSPDKVREREKGLPHLKICP